MTAPGFVVEPLARFHDRATFSCGVEPLDRYLRQQARQDIDRSLAAVFVLVDVETERIAGYYTLSALSILVTDLPHEVAPRLPRYPIPATLLGRLAVDHDYQGRRLGLALLVDALAGAYAQRQQLGAMAVIVDAKGERARTFYERHQFRRLNHDPFRQFIAMGTIGKLLGSQD